MIRKVIVLPDLHYPYQINLRPVEKFIRDIKPTHLIYLGDQMNMDAVCHWIEDKKRPLEGKRLKEEYDGMNEILDRMEAIAGEKTEYIYFEGNHENWVEQYLDHYPNFEGMIEVPENLHLKYRKYKWIPFNRWYKIGKLYFIHGYYTNKYHAEKTARAFKRSVMYGHTHQFQVYTDVSPVDLGDAHTAMSIGCLCDLNPDYWKNKPSNWTHGFGLAYIWPNGNFNMYFIKIVDGHFIFNNKLYD